MEISYFSDRPNRRPKLSREKDEILLNKVNRMRCAIAYLGLLITSVADAKTVKAFQSCSNFSQYRESNRIYRSAKENFHDRKFKSSAILLEKAIETIAYIDTIFMNDDTLLVEGQALILFRKGKYRDSYFMREKALLEKQWLFSRVKSCTEING